MPIMTTQAVREASPEKMMITTRPCREEDLVAAYLGSQRYRAKWRGAEGLARRDQGHHE